MLANDPGPPEETRSFRVMGPRFGVTDPLSLRSHPRDSLAAILRAAAGADSPGLGDGPLRYALGRLEFAPVTKGLASGVTPEKVFGEIGAQFLNDHPSALHLWRFLARAHLSKDLDGQWCAKFRALGADWKVTFLDEHCASISLALNKGEMIEPALCAINEAAMVGSALQATSLTFESDGLGTDTTVTFKSSPVPLTPILEQILARLHHYTEQGSPVAEDFRFVIPKISLIHQNALRCLDVFVSYRYTMGDTRADYPDFLHLERDIRAALAAYPDADHYWELVNLALTQSLLARYPRIDRIAVTLDVHPDESVPFHRSSTVALRQDPLRSSLTENLN